MNAPSLTGFLAMTDAKYRLFDLGTQLRKLPESALQSLDEGQPYPFPHLGYGWLAIFMWNPDFTEQNSLWFLKLPLDEQGILPAAVHSDLVNRLYRALQVTDAKERQRLLSDHPYQFKPDHEKMAALHANATKTLGLPPSTYYDPAAKYFLERNVHIDPSKLGIQGIADLVLRIHEDDLIALTNRIETFDAKWAIELTKHLEHRELPTAAVENLVSTALKTTNLDLQESCFRACAISPAKKLAELALAELIDSEQRSVELLLIVATRYPHFLVDTEQAVKVLDQLALQVDIDAFERVVTNLAMQPSLTGIVMQTLGSSKLTPTLGNALGAVIQRKRVQRHVTH